MNIFPDGLKKSLTGSNGELAKHMDQEKGEQAGKNQCPEHGHAKVCPGLDHGRYASCTNVKAYQENSRKDFFYKRVLFDKPPDILSNNTL